MGTYIIRPTVLTSGGVPTITDGTIQNGTVAWYVSSSTPPNTVLDVMRNVSNTDLACSAALFVDAGGAASSGSDTVRFAFTGNSIYLDGSVTPIAFSGLPAGWTPTSASVKISALLVANVQVEQPVSGFAHYYLQQDSLSNGPQDTQTFDYAVVPSATNLYLNGVGFKVDMSVNGATILVGDVGSVDFMANLRVEGSYSIVAGSYTFDLTKTTLETCK